MDKILKSIIASLILYLTLNSHTYAQHLTRDSLIDMVKERWYTRLYFMGDTIAVDFSLIKHSNYFKVDGKLYDSNSVNGVLKNLVSGDLTGITVAYKKDWHTRKIYEYLILIRTKKNQSKRDKKYNYERTISEYITDQYSYKDTTRLANAKDCALIINGHIIPPHLARAKLFSIDFRNMENIDAFGPGYEFPIYGENSKNGQVFIWTKKKKR